jgi:hypothetical protein
MFSFTSAESQSCFSTSLPANDPRPDRVTRLFKGMTLATGVELELVQTRTFSSRVVYLRHRVVRPVP